MLLGTRVRQGAVGGAAAADRCSVASSIAGCIRYPETCSGPVVTVAATAEAGACTVAPRWSNNEAAADARCGGITVLVAGFPYSPQQCRVSRLP